VIAGDRILHAAGELFAERGVAAVDMKDIARASGCSRATLYRHFENREALHVAYVHREAHAVGARVAQATAELTDPAERLLGGLIWALQCVRESPALSAWFARTSIGAEAAEASAVVQAMTAGFLGSLGAREPVAVDRRARWLVRVLTSLLSVPGRDAEDERALLEDFVLPVLLARSAPG